MKDLVLSGTYDDHLKLVKERTESRDFKIVRTWWDGDIFCGEVKVISTGEVKIYKINDGDVSSRLKERSSFNSKKDLSPEDVVRLLGIRFNATNDD